ncbi:hypothetical protein [Pseudanabaena phage PA-SR01]|nr:hypothetical protein [Pseudanabaena phage PA-SR01]
MEHFVNFGGNYNNKLQKKKFERKLAAAIEPVGNSIRKVRQNRQSIVDPITSPIEIKAKDKYPELNLEEPYSNLIIKRLDKGKVRQSYIRKNKSGETPRIAKPESYVPDDKNYNNIRKVDDFATSNTGYLGFNNDITHPNYWVEGEVPLLKQKAKWGRYY